MRKILALGVALTLAGFGLSSCTESDQPTELSAPEIGGPSFDMGGQGQGAVFSDNPFVQLINEDGDGDLCRARVFPPTDDINDFVRFNPNGLRFIHIADHPATIDVLTAGGDLFSGIGKWNATVVTNPTNALRSEASGKVTDGVVTKQAVCKVVRDGQNRVRVNEVDLH